jgi:MATE family multidrug resistance protein
VTPTVEHVVFIPGVLLIGVFVERHTDPVTTANLVRLGSSFLIATAAFQLFDAVAMTISGALRGAGDTVVPGLMTLLASWSVIVGGGFAFVTYAPGLSSLGPWIAAAAYIATLCLLLLSRFLSGKWKLIRLVDRPVAAH